MELEDMTRMIFGRYSDLPEEEKDILREWKNSESAMIVRKVLGPEMGSILDNLGDTRGAAPQFMAVPRGLGG